LVVLTPPQLAAPDIIKIEAQRSGFNLEKEEQRSEKKREKNKSEAKVLRIWKEAQGSERSFRQ